MLEIGKLRQNLMKWGETLTIVRNLDEGPDRRIKCHDFATHGVMASDALGQTYVAEFLSPALIERFGYIAERRVISDPSKQASQIILKQLGIEMGLQDTHPNVQQTYEYNILNGGFHIFRNFMDFGDLRKLLSFEKVLDNRISGYVICKTLLGLDFLHKKNITHGYLSPENIYFAITGDLKIANFSGCHTNNELVKVMSLPEIPNTYFAPEFKKGRFDNKVDIWSLGIIAGEVLTGKRLCSDEIEYTVDENTGKVVERVIGKKIDFTEAASLAPDAREFLRLCLEENPSKRASTEQLLESAYFKNHCHIPRELMNNFLLRVIHRNMRQRKRSQ